MTIQTLKGRSGDPPDYQIRNIDDQGRSKSKIDLRNSCWKGVVVSREYEANDEFELRWLPMNAEDGRKKLYLGKPLGRYWLDKAFALASGSKLGSI